MHATTRASFKAFSPSMPTLARKQWRSNACLTRIPLLSRPSKTSTKSSLRCTSIRKRMAPWICLSAISCRMHVADSTFSRSMISAVMENRLAQVRGNCRISSSIVSSRRKISKLRSRDALQGWSVTTKSAARCSRRVVNGSIFGRMSACSRKSQRSSSWSMRRRCRWVAKASQWAQTTSLILVRFTRYVPFPSELIRSGRSSRSA